MRKILFLLGQLIDSDLDWLIAQGTKRSIDPGDTLIKKGGEIDALYILLDGILEVSDLPNNKRIRLNAGEVVGEISLLDSRPPTATISAISKVVLLAVPRESLLHKLNTDSEFAARFYHSLAVFLAHRLRTTYQTMGFDKAQPMDESAEYEDQLSPEVLNNVHLARVRFDHALRRLMNK